LRAAARVLIECPATKFVVVGEGPEQDTIEALIDELKIRESVSLVGRRDDMPSVYGSLDVMVSSSRQEGLPMAILEGMASRLPLVATAVGDVPTVVLDGRTGLIVPPENADLLASAIMDLVQNAQRREQLGAAARKLIEDEFSADRMTAEYVRVYEKVVAGGNIEAAASKNGIVPDMRAKQ
jgi:glycosyltransferase involved in cell wall biosynthesis